MEITLLCDNSNSWYKSYEKELYNSLTKLGHNVFKIKKPEDIPNGDLAFFLSCERIISEEHLKRNKNNMVVHASDLPKGKGWSPLTWAILNGKNEVTVTLFEAIKELDAGDIYLKDTIIFDGTELIDDLRVKLGRKINELILEFVKKHPNIRGREQNGVDSYYLKRTPKDSQLDINKSINEQFNLLRVVDNERYPAFFYKNGQKYILKIYKDEKVKEDGS